MFKYKVCNYRCKTNPTENIKALEVLVPPSYLTINVLILKVYPHTYYDLSTNPITG